MLFVVFVSYVLVLQSPCFCNVLSRTTMVLDDVTRPSTTKNVQNELLPTGSAFMNTDRNFKKLEPIKSSLSTNDQSRASDDSLPVIILSIAGFLILGLVAVVMVLIISRNNVQDTVIQLPPGPPNSEPATEIEKIEMLTPPKDIVEDKGTTPLEPGSISASFDKSDSQRWAYDNLGTVHVEDYFYDLSNDYEDSSTRKSLSYAPDDIIKDILGAGRVKSS